ncbi:uncharacterized protein [Coffea arabica]|uniref:Uncharacterized protein isoform X2 n=1 Tax=Coffea arabica TaxID=13443 RepID=A0ABM4V938_COFAR
MLMMTMMSRLLCSSPHPPLPLHLPLEHVPNSYCQSPLAEFRPRPLQLQSPPPTTLVFIGRSSRRKSTGRGRALREWQDYEEAVKDKDLARALRLLKENSSIEPNDGGALQRKGDWQVLDTCLNADDMRLVASAYTFLRDQGRLPNFGKYRNIVLEGPREITPNVLTSATGLEAYLMGCPIRGVILDPIVAMQSGIQGQAGTQFWDERLQNELAEGRLSGSSFDRYCMVLFAGIAAEALVYGEAEGGENDENLFRSICVLLDPPLSVAQMSNQARWSVLQSYNLLRWHKHAHRAAIRALETGCSLSTVIKIIEEAMSLKAY